jgi:GT2 family glycosyltransferase
VTINRPKSVVAIPACNEEDQIERCLRALDAQAGARLDEIVLLLNNTTDATASLARNVRFCTPTRLHIIEVTLPPERANAGHARRLAMNEAALRAGADGLILTTDADGRVMPDWLAKTHVALAAGADVVVGWVALHPEDCQAIPVSLREADALECAYDALCDTIHARLDPDPADPLPRHTQHSGASIAVTARAFARCGGVPDVRSSEDRALIAALRRVDARVRHAPAVHVSVSGRIEGRAIGGMADTIRRRMTAPDIYLDDRLEPAADCARRAWARAEARRCYLGADPTIFAKVIGLPRTQLEACFSLTWFGTAWAAIERQSPMLRRQLVSVRDVANELATARAILLQLETSGPRAEEQAMLPNVSRATSPSAIWSGFKPAPEVSNRLIEAT